MRESLLSRLRSAAGRAGKAKPLGIGSGFYSDLRWYAMKDIKPNQYPSWSKKPCHIGTWRGRKLFIIPGSLNRKDLNDPRPWSEVEHDQE